MNKSEVIMSLRMLEIGQTLLYKLGILYLVDILLSLPGVMVCSLWCTFLTAR